MLFCPTCANLLMCEESPLGYRFICNTCPYQHMVKKRIVNRRYFKLKNIGDVLGGKAAWENVDSTNETCPKCDHPRAYFMQIQTRSADEPMTIFYRCCNDECEHQWKQ